MNESIGALIGLARAAFDHEYTPELKSLVRRALLETEVPVEELHAMKQRYAPDCAVCKSPCGRTRDYEMSEYEASEPEVREAKAELLRELKRAAGSEGYEAGFASVLAAVFMLGEGIDAASIQEYKKELPLI